MKKVAMTNHVGRGNRHFFFCKVSFGEELAPVELVISGRYWEPPSPARDGSGARLCSGMEAAPPQLLVSHEGDNTFKVTRARCMGRHTI